MMKKNIFCFTTLSFLVVSGLLFFACGDSDSIIETITRKPAGVITLTALDDYFPAPVAGKPQVNALESAEYNGVIIWWDEYQDKEHVGPFAKSTEYSAKVSLTPKEGYSLNKGVEKNTFTHKKATDVENARNSGEITVYFDPTGTKAAHTLSIVNGVVVGGNETWYVEGEEIAIIADSPTQGFKEWTTVDGNGAPVTVTFDHAKTRSATVTMPDSDLTLTATFGAPVTFYLTNAELDGDYAAGATVRATAVNPDSANKKRMAGWLATTGMTPNEEYYNAKTTVTFDLPDSVDSVDIETEWLWYLGKKFFHTRGAENINPDWDTELWVDRDGIFIRKVYVLDDNGYLAFGEHMGRRGEEIDIAAWYVLSVDDPNDDLWKYGDFPNYGLCLEFIEHRNGRALNFIIKNKVTGNCITRKDVTKRSHEDSNPREQIKVLPYEKDNTDFYVKMGKGSGENDNWDGRRRVFDFNIYFGELIAGDSPGGDDSKLGYGNSGSVKDGAFWDILPNHAETGTANLKASDGGTSGYYAVVLTDPNYDSAAVTPTDLAGYFYPFRHGSFHHNEHFWVDVTNNDPTGPLYNQSLGFTDNCRHSQHEVWMMAYNPTNGNFWEED